MPIRVPFAYNSRLSALYMKIYFYSKKEEAKRPTQKEMHEVIFKFFKENGVTVLSNLFIRLEGAEQLTFEKMDGLVVEGRTSASEVGYLIAMALSQQKPILYLLPKGAMIPDQLRSLMDNKKLKKVFLLRFYSPKILENYLIDFIDIIETGELRREVPTVKFTLRFTPRADRYLTWRSRKKRKSKANYLRNLIDEQIKNDEDYQSHLRKPKVEEDDEKDEKDVLTESLK